MPKNFLAAPKMVSFLTAGSWEKDTIFGAARKIFSPSYFVTALTLKSRPWDSGFILQTVFDLKIGSWEPRITNIFLNLKLDLKFRKASRYLNSYSIKIKFARKLVGELQIRCTLTYLVIHNKSHLQEFRTFSGTWNLQKKMFI